MDNSRIAFRNSREKFSIARELIPDASERSKLKEIVRTGLLMHSLIFDSAEISPEQAGRL